MRIGSTKNLDYMTRYLKVSWETRLLDDTSELLITTRYLPCCKFYLLIALCSSMNLTKINKFGVILIMDDKYLQIVKSDYKREYIDC